MSYSLNEVESTAKKAARGVGYSWGLAEDTAKSARWLCGQNIDGCAVLARHLEYVDQFDIASLTPVVNGKQWQALNAHMCPVLAGTALSDRASLFDEDGINLLSVSEPLMLLYFAALVAQFCRMKGRDRAVVVVSWPGCRCSTDGASLTVFGSENQHSSECAVQVTLNFDDMVGLPQTRCDRANPTERSLKILNNFAFRTYAPATEASRLSGAGAGQSDND